MGMSMWGSGGFCPLMFLMFAIRKGTGKCLHRCFMPPSWSSMQDGDAAIADPELLHRDRSPAATLGTLLQNSPVLRPEVVGSGDTLCN